MRFFFNTHNKKKRWPIKLWIDDIRPAPDGYIWALSVISAKNDILRYERMGEPLELIDIDHDAGDYGPSDYIKILDWLEETGRNYPIHIHSANPVGIANMRRIIKRNGWKEIV